MSPEVCVTERPIIYRCVCNQGYTGDGTDCTGEPIESAGRHLCYAKMVNTLLSIDAILVIQSDYIGLGLYSQKYDANPMVPPPEIAVPPPNVVATPPGDFWSVNFRENHHIYGLVKVI